MSIIGHVSPQDAPARGPGLAGISNEASREPYLVLRGIGKTFGRFVALQDIDLEIAKGEFVCFLGPSGCGKTTLLRIIAGLENQGAGTIRQGGRDISALAPTQRDYGIVFQSYALFPNLTVFDNVACGLVNRRMKRDAVARRVKELLTIIGLPPAGPKYPNQLSGGEQQRVAQARVAPVGLGQTVTMFLSLNNIAERSLEEGSTFRVCILGDRMRVFES